MVSVCNPNDRSVEEGAEDDEKSLCVVFIWCELPCEGSLLTEKDLDARILCGSYGDVAIWY